ncbi:unnamed protein product [Phyllotreta striolata]|uniref:Zinc finger protein 865 n=1 Tax=Phyllotreta striolata TaxID=444603 RepID=A0A9N9TP19_PHYSR|nr:unnamed protein product [Phyllotreta striolata]
MPAALEMKTARERPRKFECGICEKRFASGNDLRKHIRTHTDERPYACQHCPLAFRQAGSLKNHVACKHRAALDSTNENAEAQRSFVCAYCAKSFPVKDRLKLHLRTHTGDRPYECPHCQKRFARGGQLIQHVRTHTGSKPYVCLVCRAGFTCSANLKLHMNRHLEIRDFVCDVCGKRFYRRDALRKHLTCYHAGVKAFRCRVCDKRLKGHLPQHMRIHERDKPHGCAHCGAKFAQRSQLTVHQRTHSGERPYRCRVCWKAFAHSTALKLHVRRHTGERPFGCASCAMRFAQLPHLKKHVLAIHKSDKPYACAPCGSFHRTKSELEEHRVGCKALVEVKMDAGASESSMPAEKMRYLLAILLKKISSAERLKALGFNKRLIDEVLVESIENSGRAACKDGDLEAVERLKRNVQILLEWTVPKSFMDRFKQERRSTEELLKELTS